MTIAVSRLLVIEHLAPSADAQSGLRFVFDTDPVDDVAERENAGRPIGTADAQVAAICATRGATLATRNTADFQGTGIDLVNPWDG